jgi:hypothetical protein
MELTSDILGAHLLDLLWGGLTFAFLLGRSSTRKKWGWGFLIVYVMSTIGTHMEATFVSVGAIINVLAFGIGGCVAFGVIKWRQRS